MEFLAVRTELRIDGERPNEDGLVEGISEF